MVRNLIVLWTAVLAAALAPAGAAWSQFGDDFGLGGPGKQAQAAAEPDRPEVIVSGFANAEAVAPGERFVVSVVLDHAEGWHTWPSAVQDVLPDEVAGFALRTSVTLGTESANGWIRGVGPIQWPEPHDVANPLGEPPTIKSYHERAPIYVPLLVADDAEPGERTLVLEVFYQSCNDRMCLAPETVSVEVPIMVAAETLPAALTDQQREDLEDFDESSLDLIEAGSISAESPGAEPEENSEAPSFRLFGLDFGSGWVGLAIASLLGGALLNLMPCVLPVIPIKIMTLSQHAQGSRRRTMGLGLSMAIGVAAFWIVVGIPVAATAGSIDPSAIFSFWPVTLGMGLVLALMGLGIMGLFTMNLPKSVYMVNPKADSLGGSFMFGVMTAVLGLPCFGPIVGGLLAGGTALPWQTVMTVFTCLGLGMAAPYLVLSAYPGLVKKLPQSGPAGELVKQAMGLLMIAAGVFFASAGVKTLFKNHPFLADDSEYLFAGVILIIAGLWVIWNARKAAKGLLGAGAVAVLGAGIVAASVWGLSALMKPSDWEEFSVARLEAARASGKTVLVDFTADWCITCRAFKAQALDPEPARSRLLEDDIVLLEADFDRPEVKEFLREELGRTGIPVWALYPADGGEPMPIDLPTSPGRVVEYLDQAAGVDSLATGPESD